MVIEENKVTFNSVTATEYNTIAATVNDITDNGLPQKLTFVGTDHAGIKLISLTTAQRDALTGVNGDIIYNSTTNTVQAFQNSAWSDVGGSGGTDPVTITVDDADNSIGLTLTQSDVTNNPAGVSVENDGTGNGIFINQDGNGSALSIDSEATSNPGVIIDMPDGDAHIRLVGDSGNASPTEGDLWRESDGLKYYDGTTEHNLISGGGGGGGDAAWTLLETVTFAGETSLSTGTLTAHDEYMIVIKGLKPAGGGTFRMRIDADTGNNYSFRTVSTTGITNSTSQSSFNLFPDKNGAHPLFGYVFVQGKGAPGQNRNKVTCNLSPGDLSAAFMLAGTYAEGATSAHQIESFTFFVSSAAITSGDVVIFGRTL